MSCARGRPHVSADTCNNVDMVTVGRRHQLGKDVAQEAAQPREAQDARHASRKYGHPCFAAAVPVWVAPLSES
jgi:hypothetical protein|eukprot:COSAG01_NODE_277_length_19582_cov_28.126726_5_plen_73_part_00